MRDADIFAPTLRRLNGELPPMRARTLKSQIHLNEDLARLGDSAYKLFTGLLGLADRDGRLEDRPERIKAAVAPYHGRPGFPDWDCHRMLQILKEHGFIQRYEVDGTRCIQITSWKKHAKPHKDEVSLDLPEPPKVTEKPGNFTKSPETSGSISEHLSSISEHQPSTSAAETRLGDDDEALVQELVKRGLNTRRARVAVGSGEASLIRCILGYFDAELKRAAFKVPVAALKSMLADPEGKWEFERTASGAWKPPRGSAQASPPPGESIVDVTNRQRAQAATARAETVRGLKGGEHGR